MPARKRATSKLQIVLGYRNGTGDIYGEGRGSVSKHLRIDPRPQFFAALDRHKVRGSLFGPDHLGFF